ncbi:MAG: ankyrin repeat domain-containing protein [Lachnospiraceae bacterium]|nr:ankyrin repeat domain-containing protein [Lachnospiraceae bacterium]
MARLRKTLPKNFEELLNQGDIDELKAVLEKCELYAYSGYSKKTALFFPNIPDELVRYLVQEKGMKINHPDIYGTTPLHKQAEYGSKNLELFIELGANMDAVTKTDKETPLHVASYRHHVDAVKTLIAHGAKINAKNWQRNNPLEAMLRSCPNMDIEKVADIAEIFLNQGMKINNKMKEQVQRIGKNFEFYKADFNPDYLEVTEQGLNKLYQLFSVPPVPPLKRHNGISKITVINGTWPKQHNALWELLVPGRGQANTVQGEVIRISGRVAREVMDNGGMNWDNEYRKMLKYLLDCFAEGNPLTEKELKEAQYIGKLISHSGEADDEPERLMELAVKWVAQNTEPIQLGEVEYKR